LIRVNLLTQKRDAKKGPEPAQTWLLVVMGVLLVEIVGLIVFHQSKREELALQRRTNAELSSQIEQIKTAIANHAEVKAQLEGLRAREQAIKALESGRTGPTAILLELSQLLTPGRGPTVDADQLAQLRKDNPAVVFNPGWDSRRLWLTSYQENDHVVKIEGVARDGDDVSELARRLNLSLYFSDVKLLPGSRSTDSETKLELVHFQLQAKAKN
jgi:type IV pilus assembly protein PilN